MGKPWYEGFIYIGVAVSATYFYRLPPRCWIAIGTSFSVFGYLFLFPLLFVPVQYFPIFQTLCGMISGFGAGFCMANLVITPQQGILLYEAYKCKA